jgi:glutathione reductase (NADPH)
MAKYDFDLFVIGAGSGGVRLARMSGAMGARVAVAEDRYLGGTCVNVGCVPKKLFVYASHVTEELEDAEGFGWCLDGKLSLDWSKLVTNKNKEIARLNGIYGSLLENNDVQIIDGRATIIDAHTVSVAEETYTAERIVIATGGWPRMPEVPGAEHMISSNEFFFMEELPKKAVVLGGGYIAVELAGILNGLGVETTLIYRGSQILRGFDEEVRAFVSNEVANKGVKVILNDNIEAIEKKQDGLVAVLESGRKLEAGVVLSAIGRVPKTEGLGLEKLGVEMKTNGGIAVNEHFQTSVPSIYALGDVIGGVQLTPVALAEGMYLANYFFAATKPLSVDYDFIPTAVFCQPNIGTVGLTEEEAKERIADVQVFVSSFKPMKHTMSGRNERSMMKLIVDEKTDRVVGAHMVGPEAGEIIQGLAIAIKAGATKAQFDRTIGIHPTAAEEFVTMRQQRD